MSAGSDSGGRGDWLWRTALLGGGVGVSVGVGGLLPPTEALLTGFDIGILAYLVVTAWDTLRLDAADLRTRVRALDEGRRPWVVLGVGLMLTAVVLVALVVELKARSEPSVLAMGLAMGSLLLSWLFFNVLFALHYADVYYSQAGGVSFPEAIEPDARDFLYFAFTIGMTFQVSDGVVVTSAMRRRVLVHSMTAFLFGDRGLVGQHGGLTPPASHREALQDRAGQGRHEPYARPMWAIHPGPGIVFIWRRMAPVPES